ncbi:double zinc ribbon domain-containing protein [Paenibacillus cymbidii]|uniref:double zinc ribbon domain-containing protein n=1 Tax=Paenibacillus cymbidii TaxID=1639034 RepID=UPI0010818D7F|nr:zinc ribbon domain-containing protein [Paenibacillus cymbidii]
MSGFFQKMKEGASKAADKAQQAMEVQKLNSQISGAKKEIDKLKHQIGDVVYAAYQADRVGTLELDLTALSRQIAAQEANIAELELKIKETKNQKDCPSCKQTVALDTKFCPGCGHKFEAAPAAAAAEDAPACASCQAELEPDSKFCTSCGQPVAQ